MLRNLVTSLSLTCNLTYLEEGVGLAQLAGAVRLQEDVKVVALDLVRGRATARARARARVRAGARARARVRVKARVKVRVRVRVRDRVRVRTSMTLISVMAAREDECCPSSKRSSPSPG